MNMNSCSCNSSQMKVTNNRLIDQSFGKMLRLIGDEKRLQILTTIQDGGEHCVCEFEEHLTGVSQSLLSHHLADLRNAGLVETEKKGLRVYYRLTDYGGRVMSVLQNVKKELEDEWLPMQQ